MSLCDLRFLRRAVPAFMAAAACCVLFSQSGFDAIAADWRAPADFLISTQVTNPGLPAWTATMGEGPVNCWINAPFEPVTLRRKWAAREDSASSVVLYQSDLNPYDSAREGWLDGATIRAYRLINGALTKVREDVVAPGGHRSSGWNRRDGDQLIAPGVTQYQYAVASYSNPHAAYHFMVRAVDTEGNESADSNYVAVTPGATGGTTSNSLISFGWPAPSGTPPAAPTNLQASVTPGTGLITLTWDPVADSDLAGYKIYYSDYPPGQHRGYGLDLMTSPADPNQHIKAGDLIFVSNDLDHWSRKRYLSNRVWNASSNSPPPIPTYMPGPPDEDAGFSWQLVPHPGPIPAGFEDRGRTCVRFDMADARVWNCQRYVYSGTGQSYYKVLEPGKTYVVEVWLRAEAITAPVTFKLTGYYGSRVAPIPFTPTAQWQKFIGTFTVSPLYTGTQAGQMVLSFNGPGTLWVDNWRVYEQQADFMDFPQVDYDALAASALSFIRTHAIIKSGLGYSMHGLTNFPGGMDYWGGRQSTNHTLASLLNMMRKSHADPWLQMEMYMSEEEWLGFVEYMAAPYDPMIDTPAAKPWAFKRYQQGRAAPWTDAFHKILFEISNETWNGLFAPWTFMGFQMTDSVTGQVVRDGWLLGKFQEYVISILKSSPYWSPEVDSKFEFVIGGWSSQAGPTGYGPAAAQNSPRASHVTIAGYNGGWDEGETPAEPTDEGFFKAMAFTPQAAEPKAIECDTTRRSLLAQGKADYHDGTYEAGPGYHLDGLNGDVMTPQQVESESRTMKSLAGGVATLDSFLCRAQYGFRLQNFFTFQRNRHYWTSHAPYTSGGQAYPCWSALTLFNLHATGDLLLVQPLSSPTWDLPATSRRAARPNAPMTAAYASRQGNRYSVFVLSRKLDNYPVAGDDGFTSATLRLPFVLDPVSTITLYRMTGDPRVHNLDAENIVIETVNIPTAQFSQDFTLNAARGADERGLPPGSIYLYVFEGATTPAPAVQPGVVVNQAATQSDPYVAVDPVEVRFTANFNQPVTGFGDDPGDVVLSGTALAGSWRVEEVYGSQGMSYTIIVTDFKTQGTVSVTVPAGAAQAQSGGYNNSDSIFYDNEVTIIFPHGLPLAEWEFLSSSVSFYQNPDCTVKHEYVSTATIVAGSGLTVGNNRYYNDDAFGVTNAHSTAPSPTDYLSWTLQPTAGGRLSLKEVHFGSFCAATGDDVHFFLACSRDGFATSHTVSLTTNTIIGRGLGNTAGSPVDGDLSAIAELQGVDGPVEFRLYLWGASGQYTATGIGKLGPDVVDLSVRGFAGPAGLSLPPYFSADPIVRPKATANEPYAASLAGEAVDPDSGDTVTYLKVNGPAWLNVAPGGALSGTPSPADVGPNTFIIRARDGAGLFDDTTLHIPVDPPVPVTLSGWEVL